ncbi:rhodanese-like domain-containing protein [Streptomyces sp. NPDC057702]|uniref:rhodanese-like domain-containing protein n=1 Tax=unclassified Streptomyces TaxID=2593676 RepID=UPI00368F22A9
MLAFLRRHPGRHTPHQARHRARQQTNAGGAAPLDLGEAPGWDLGPVPGARPFRPVAGARFRGAARGGPAPARGGLVVAPGGPVAAPGGPVVVIRRSGRRSRRVFELLGGRGVPATGVTGGTAARACTGLPAAGRGSGDGGIA